MSRTVNSVLALVTSVIFALALTLFIIPRSSGNAQAANPSVLFQSGTKKIISTYTISKDCILPEGATLNIKSGGILYIKAGVKFTVNGTLNVTSGCSVLISGQLITAKNSKLTNTGKIYIQKSGTLSLGGKLTVNESGKIQGLGTLEVLNNFSDINCKGTVTAKIKPPAPITKNGVTTVGGVIIVNRQYSLPEDYGSGLDSAAYSAYLAMKKASGYNMSIVSGFRSYEKQKITFNYWASIDGFAKADTYSAQPGHSEHQTGLAIDISSLSQSYGETAEGKWLAEHCWEYGFIIRYPEGGEKITGYMYEPWHVRYLGTSTAKLVHDSGLTLEEFLGVA